MGRKLWLLLGLAGAIGLPLWLTSAEGLSGVLGGLLGNDKGGKKPPLTALEPSWSPTMPFSPLGQGLGTLDPAARVPVEGPPVADLAEVFKFDITPAWILSRWPHVLTVGGADQFQGYRVPLVTGTSEGDLAGTLTYYFATKPVVQRIKFEGVTGDPARLVALVTSRFRFVKQASPEPSVHVYQIRWHGRPNSQLVLRMADAIRADAPLRRFSIDLEINLPDVPPSMPMLGAK